MPPKNSECPWSRLIPCRAACPCPAPGPRSLPSRGPAVLGSTADSGSDSAGRAQITPKIPKGPVTASAGQRRRGEEKTRPPWEGGCGERLCSRCCP